MPIRKLVLFDIDGTLLISNGATREAKALAMEEFFGTAATSRTHSFGGKTDWQILSEVLAPHGYTAREIGEKMPAFERVFAAHLRQIIDDFEVVALPGTHQLVETLHQRDDVMVGLLTGNTSLTGPIKTEAAGFDNTMFVVGAYGNESDDRNELPKIALQRANGLLATALKPADVLILGDTPRDVECAKVNDMVSVAVMTGYSEQADLEAADPDYLLPDLTTFLEVVLLE